jgi:hypothetical protein
MSNKMPQLKPSKNAIRQDFPKKVTQQIAQTAMYICAKCLCLTGYSTSEGKARAIAEAAHMTAASANGPRGDPSRSKDYLRSAENGIWLCKKCHSLIDDDPAAYPEKALGKLKTDHEDVIRRIVGKDLEAALLDLRNHKRYYDETREFISFLESKRVLYELMDNEFPPRVLDSLELIRERLVQTRAKVNSNSDLTLALNQLQKAINSFLRDIGKDTDLRELRCNGEDPKWVRFSSELVKLRNGIIIIVKVLSGNADYKLTWL